MKHFRINCNSGTLTGTLSLNFKEDGSVTIEVNEETVKVKPDSSFEERHGHLEKGDKERAFKLSQRGKNSNCGKIVLSQEEVYQLQLVLKEISKS